MLDGTQPIISQRPWRDRANSMATLPGKTAKQADALRRVVAQLPAAASGSLTLLDAAGREKEYSAESVIASQLSGSRLAVRDSESYWIAPEQVQFWYSTGDDPYLARYLHANVKFFGEMLQCINENTRTADLVDAASKYGLPWRSPDQIHRRIGWMQSLGLLERWGLARLVVTERGRELLQAVELVDSREARDGSPSLEAEHVDLPEVDLDVAAALEALTLDRLKERRVLIGYVPRGRNAQARGGEESSAAALDSLRRFVELLGDGASADEFFQQASEQLGQKRSSFNQSLHTFRHMQMIDMVAFGRYAPTRKAIALLQLGNEVNLVRHLHAQYRFVGELLNHLHDVTTVSEMATIAQSRYGLRQVDNAEVRLRLALMADAGLVERIDWTRYRATASGQELAKELPQEPELSLGPDHAAPMAEAEDPAGTISDIREDLRRYGRLSDASEDFERSVARAFEVFGFRAEHLGGSGRTDVLVEAQLSAADRFRSIVDAKASASGVIGDNAVNFDVLKGHQRKHAAQYGLIVGPDFSTRVKEWASDNKMALLTIDELVGLLERHERAPLTLRQLRSLFQHSQSDLSEIEEQYDREDHVVQVMARLVEMLFREANEEDPVAEGFISRENLHYVLRKEILPRPSKAIIDDLLLLLESDLVRAVERNGERFKLVDAPWNIMHRLRRLGSGLSHVVVPTDS